MERFRNTTAYISSPTASITLTADSWQANFDMSPLFDAVAKVRSDPSPEYASITQREVQRVRRVQSEKRKKNEEGMKKKKLLSNIVGTVIIRQICVYDYELIVP